jgi:hypothetical protein
MLQLTRRLALLWLLVAAVGFALVHNVTKALS